MLLKSENELSTQFYGPNQIICFEINHEQTIAINKLKMSY